MHQLDDRLCGLDRRLGKHAVPEIEDVSGPPPGARQDVAHPLGERGARRQQGRGVEVSLDRPRADPAPRLVERDAPVHADDVAAAAAKSSRNVAGSVPKWITGTPAAPDSPSAPRPCARTYARESAGGGHPPHL